MWCCGTKTEKKKKKEKSCDWAADGHSSYWTKKGFHGILAQTL